jgi:phage tail-like protein
MLSLLPAIYREDALLGSYLKGFEDVLLELEQKIDGISGYFDPRTVPVDFLPWLSSWVALTLRADLEEARKRAFLARVVPLYLRRGTLQNLQDLLGIFTRGVSTVEESVTEPHRFKVTMRLPPTPAGELLRQRSIARSLIDLEKPAHTDYDLHLLFPSMQIFVTSHIGLDTLLGTGSGT